ncbi:hypothetical protein GF327_09425 [Candidatus Woesearchaeota archaeon]|nr:hypothetical protein [Candidatus Woesearchaeota archaeon]
MTHITDFSAYGFNRIIKYKGVFDFDGLYKFVRKWLTDRDWDFFEIEAKEKPPWIIYKWMAFKKITFYAALQIKINFRVWEPKEVIILKDGQKKKMMDARLKIDLSGAQITDYDGDFEKSAFLKKVETFLNAYVLYHENLLKYFDYLDYYMHGLMTEIKDYLGMETASNAY